MRPRAVAKLLLVLITVSASSQTHRPPWATPANDHGPIPDSTLIHLIVTLARTPTQQRAFDQLLEDQENPSSPQYHHWLTSEQIGQQFGPDEHVITTTTIWLQAQGISIEAITPSRTYIQAIAPASAINAAFKTELHTYAAGQAPTTEPTIPSSIAYIDGLTQTQHQTHAVKIQSNFNLTSSTGATRHFLAPADFATAYDITPAYAANITGTGQRVAIIGGSRLNPSDLATWESLSALPSAQPTYIVPPGSAFSDPGLTNNNDQAEGTLDYERVYGTAPGSAVDQIISTNWLNGTTTAALILYAINTVRDPILSLSFGACEAQQTSAYVQYESSIFAQAAAQGIGVFVSSGDAGAAACEQQGQPPPATQTPAISDLCASPYVTCVGGTQFSDLTSTATYWSAANNPATHASLLSYIPEGAWNEPTGPSASIPFIVSATGGGRSTIIPKPSFQTGIGVPADGFRDIPDISFSASTHNAYFACLAFDHADCTSTYDGFGGTSASAPSMAGIAALLNQKLGSPQGNLNALLYHLAATAPTAFHDATPATSGIATCTTATATTCNNSNPAPQSLSGGLVGFPLTTGYDQSTGLGSLDVAAFLNAAASLITPAPTFTLTPTPTTLATTAGAPITDAITIATTTNFTGQITFTCTITPAASIPPTCTLSPTTLTYPTTASTTVTITTTAPHANFRPQAALALAAIFFLISHRRRRPLRPALLTLLVLTGCGSGTINAVSPTLTGGTTPGTYTVTVTGTTPTQTSFTTVTLTVN